MIDGFSLKLLAAALMFLDHIHQFIPNAPVWFTWLGRLVAPIFFFLMVEGFFYTRDRNKYFLRLFIGAAIMYIGSGIVSALTPSSSAIPNNIFLSLSLAVLLLINLEKAKNAPPRSAQAYLRHVAVGLIALLSLFSEASIIGLAMTLIFYSYRNKKSLMALWYLLLSFLLFIPAVSRPPGLTVASLTGIRAQWMMAFALPFFFLYSGKRGLNTPAAKYFFYFFYPLHIWFLYILGSRLTG